MITGSLIILLLLQQLFWSITAHRLINKIMSKNFFEYQQAEQAFVKKDAPKLVEPEPQDDLGVLDGVGGF